MTCVGERTEVLVIDCSSMPEIDYTIVQVCGCVWVYVGVFLDVGVSMFIVVVVQELSETNTELHKLHIKMVIVGAQVLLHVWNTRLTSDV